MPESNEHIANVQNIFRSERELFVAVLALGCTSIVTQIVLLREFLSVFYGNELVIGIIFANWMVLTGAGSFLGKYADRIKYKFRVITISLWLIALLPIGMVFLLRYLRNIVFDAGSMVGLLQILYSSFLLMMPYCLLTGFLFVLCALIISERFGSNLIPLVYSVEAFGSIVGGVLFNLIMIYFLKTFQSLFILLAFDLIAAIYLSVRHGTIILRSVIIVCSIGCLVVAIVFNFDDKTKEYLFPDQQVLAYHDTPYGNLTVTRQAEQLNFYENSILLFSTNDVTQNEEAVHYAMIQAPHPRTVLLISGGITGTTSEILKYDVGRVDYLELNPWIIKIGKEYTSALDDSRIHVVNEDARRYIRSTSGRYDVALINLPDPGTTQINRFYTVEFLHDLKLKLTAGAVVSYAVLPAQEYVSGEAGGINSIMYNTLKEEFQNVLIVPGMKNYFLASDNPLDIDITRLIDLRGIPTSYVNKYYLDDRMLRERSGQISATLLPGAPVNRDFEPVSYYRQLLYWLQYFRYDVWIVMAVCLIGFLFVSMKFNPVNCGIFTGGFAASSVEILLLIAFQIIYGYVYQMIGLIVTVFMAGLAIGSLCQNKLFPTRDTGNYARIQFCIGSYSIILPLVFVILKNVSLPGILVALIFSILTLVVALFIGMEFAFAVKLKKENIGSVASELYGIDLFGSAAGALLTAAYLLPRFGVVRVSIGVGILSILSGIIFLLRGQKNNKTVVQTG
jgi:spermidine synthase